MVPTRRLHAVQRVMPVLLKADFNAAVAAPLPSPYGVDVGTLTTTQADGQLSTAGGALVFPSQATAGYGELGFASAGVSRVVGRSLLADLVVSSGDARALNW